MTDGSIEQSIIEQEPQPITQIMVVDDEPTVRALNSRYLREIGNTNIVTANDGQAGLELFQSLGGNTDLIISDNTMPGMKGEEMLGEIKKINPDVFAVLASGDADLDDKMEMFDALGINVVLRKPTTGEDLKRILDQAREWKKEREKLRAEG